MPGRQIQEGCVVPAIAGGICQLSNALYDCALRAGFTIIERHAHTRSLPNAAWAIGRDATVAWNHIDLRFRSDHDAEIRAFLTRDELIVQVWSDGATLIEADGQGASAQDECASCETCGMSKCWRHPMGTTVFGGNTTAWLVDQVTPELSHFLSESVCDEIHVPISGQPRYKWPIKEGIRTREARWIALRRSIASRRLADQGAVRQQVLSRFDAELAASYGRQLRFDSTHVVVTQTLLPHLWKIGALGGRTFDVLMTRLPMRRIHEVLDDAAVSHPDRALLSDYRADPDLIESEDEAIAAASRLITPHPTIAAECGDRAVLLDWLLPAPTGVRRGGTIVFPGPTVARKGAYELRHALLASGLRLRALGSLVEGPHFWSDIELDDSTGDWLDGARVVVQPALIEDQPRKLLRAISEGVPVIATPACGVSHLPGVTTVPAGDVSALARAIRDAVQD